jgi:hypothetical protein
MKKRKKEKRRQPIPQNERSARGLRFAYGGDELLGGRLLRQYLYFGTSKACKLRTLPALEPHSIKLLVKRGDCKSYYTAPFRRVTTEQKKVLGEKILENACF